MKQHTVAIGSVKTKDFWYTGVGFASLYLLTLSVNHSEAEDSLRHVEEVTHYLEYILQGSNPYHANYLLFSPLSFIIYQVSLLLGHEGNALIPMQIASIIAAVATLLIMLQLSRILALPRSTSLFMVALTGSCYGFWQYAVEAETYMLPIPFFLMAIVHWMRCVTASSSKLDVKNAYLVGFYCSLAILLHQQYVLLAITLWLGLWLTMRGSKKQISQTTKALGCSILIMAILVGVPYLLVAALVTGKLSLIDALTWSRGMAAGGLWTEPSLMNFPKAIAGVARSLFGTDYLFGFDRFYAILKQVFPNKLLIEERFLALGINPVVRLVCLSLLGIALVAIMALIAICFRGRAEIAGLQRTIIRLIAAMIAVVAGFTILWEPQNIEFWIPVLPLSAIAVAIVLSNQTVPHGLTLPASTALVMSLFLSNLMGSIYPKTNTRLDFWYQAQKQAIETLKSGDLIWTQGGYIGDAYLINYVPGITLVGPDQSDVVFERMQDPNFNANIYVSSWVEKPIPELAPRRKNNPASAFVTMTAMDSLSEHLELVTENQWQEIYRYNNR